MLRGLSFIDRRTNIEFDFSLAGHNRSLKKTNRTDLSGKRFESTNSKNWKELSIVTHDKNNAAGPYCEAKGLSRSLQHVYLRPSLINLQNVA